MTIEDITAIHTFGDSILDCSKYTGGVTPAALLARNDDELFPEFRGRDLSTLLGREIKVVHRAEDGATVSWLPAQIDAGSIPDSALTMLTIGGNDLLQGLLAGGSADLRAFEQALRSALARLSHTHLFVGNIYDPSFGDDSRNFLDIDPAPARRAHESVNGVLTAETARARGELVDLHRHFLAGDPSHLTAVIEPSRTGASEVRRAFLAAFDGIRKDRYGRHS